MIHIPSSNEDQVLDLLHDSEASSMSIARNVVAVDFGAESGRLVLCRWNGSEGTLEEIHRFPNAPSQVDNHLVWDLERLWEEVLQGLGKPRQN